ncbi:hypothetical protein BC828DRAFT_409239 [Blastocladiella britannica]|nr:hypothetical protein BC828DRAFT_409239 [Blastocladiella britannica]
MLYPLLEPHYELANGPKLQFNTCSVTLVPDSGKNDDDNGHAWHTIYVFGGKVTGGKQTGHVYNLSDTIWRVRVPATTAQLSQQQQKSVIQWEELTRPADARDDTWPTPRSAPAVAFHAETRELLVSGGFGFPLTLRTPTPPPGRCAVERGGTAEMLGDLWAYNVDRGTWRMLPITTDPLTDHTATIDRARNVLVLAGGVSPISGSMIMPSLLTCIDLSAINSTTAATESAVTLVSVQHLPVAFRRRRHTAAWTAEGLLMVGGRDEKAVVPDPQLIKLRTVEFGARGVRNHAGSSARTLAATGVPQLALAAAIADILAPPTTTPGAAFHGTPAAVPYASSVNHARIVELPAAPHDVVFVVNFPPFHPSSSTAGSEAATLEAAATHIRMYSMRDAAFVLGVDVLELPTPGPHLVLPSNPNRSESAGVVCLASTFDSATVVRYSRWAYLPSPASSLSAHFGQPMGDSLPSPAAAGLAQAMAALDLSSPPPPMHSDSESSWLPERATVVCGGGGAPDMDGHEDGEIAITVYPRLAHHLPHLQSLFDRRRGFTESTSLRAPIPTSDARVARAVLEFAYTGVLSLSPLSPSRAINDDVDTARGPSSVVLGVYHVAAVWCVDALRDECRRWIRAKVARTGVAQLLLVNADQDEEGDSDAAILMAWLVEAQRASDLDTVRVLEWAFRVWGIEMDQDGE